MIFSMDTRRSWPDSLLRLYSPKAAVHNAGNGKLKISLPMHKHERESKRNKRVGNRILRFIRLSAHLMQQPNGFLIIVKHTCWYNALLIWSTNYRWERRRTNGLGIHKWDVAPPATLATETHFRLQTNRQQCVPNGCQSARIAALCEILSYHNLCAHRNGRDSVILVAGQQKKKRRVNRRRIELDGI